MTIPTTGMTTRKSRQEYSEVTDKAVGMMKRQPSKQYRSLDFGDEVLMKDTAPSKEELRVEARENSEIKKGPFRGYRGFLAFFMLGMGGGSGSTGGMGTGGMGGGGGGGGPS